MDKLLGWIEFHPWMVAGAVTVLVTVVLAWVANGSLRRLEILRRLRLDRRDSFDALDVPASLGSARDAEQQREEARASVGRRFSIFRRTLVPLILVVGLSVAILPGIDTISAAMLSVLAGVLSIIVGIAARPFLENFMGGLVITLSNKLHVGDTVYVDGQLGTIADVTATHTVVKIWNWQRYLVPNAVMLSKQIHNCTHRDRYLWTHIEFYVSYEQDFDELEALAREIAGASPHFAGKDRPELWAMELEENAIKCWLAAWAEGPESAWYLRNDMRRGLVKAFQERGIKSHLLRIVQDRQATDDTAGPRAPAPEPVPA